MPWCRRLKLIDKKVDIHAYAHFLQDYSCVHQLIGTETNILHFNDSQFFNLKYRTRDISALPVDSMPSVDTAQTDLQMSDSYCVRYLMSS